MMSQLHDFRRKTGMTESRISTQDETLEPAKATATSAKLTHQHSCPIIVVSEPEPEPEKIMTTFV